MNSSGSTRLKVLDQNNSIVAETNQIEGTINSRGYHDYTFEITNNANFVDNNQYHFQIVDGGNNVTIYDSLIHNEDKYFTRDWFINNNVYAGDNLIPITMYIGDSKNISLEDLDINFDFVHAGTGDQLDYTIGNITYKDYEILFDLKLSKNISFGEFIYTNDYGYESYLIVTVPKPVLGYYNIDTSEIENCSNLDGTIYTGTLYGHSGIIQENINIKKIDDRTLQVSNMETLSNNQSYHLAVREDEVFIGLVNLNVASEYETNEIRIIGNYEINDEEGQNGQIYEISYFTPKSRILFNIKSDSYAYVRFSENEEELSNINYHAIRETYDEILQLSSGEGEKTVYFQFCDSNEIQSEILTWKCCIVPDDELKLISTAINPDTAVIPLGTDFTVSIVSNNRLCTAFAELVYGSEYEWGDADIFTLNYIEETEAGYLFEKTFNSTQLDTWKDYYQIDLYIKSYSSQISEKDSRPIYFGDLANVILPSFENISKTVYTNQNNYELSGYATADSTVTVKCINTATSEEYNFTELVNSNSRFSINIEGLSDGRYRVSATDGSLSTINDCYLVVDTIAPVITSLSAVKTDGVSNDNITVSWTTDDTDIAYYLLWKDDAQLISKEDDYKGKSFISIGAGFEGETYKVVAVDLAGNESLTLEETLGDTEPPTAPGKPEMSGRASKSIIVSWAASTDNVYVEGYDVYRDDVKIANVAATSFSDTGLIENQTYTYKVKAYDRAGNYSDYSESLTVNTVSPVFDSELTTDLLSEYIFEETSFINLLSTVEDSGNLNGLEVKFQYKLQSSEIWIDLKPLIIELNTFSYNWDISSLAQENYDFRYIAIDKDGVSVQKKYAVSLKHDYTPPEITVLSPGEGQTYAKKINVSVYATDDIEMGNITLYSSLNGIDYTIVRSFANDGAEDLDQSSPMSTSSTRISFDWNVSSMGSSPMYIKIAAKDAYGNESEQVLSVEIDNAAPATPGEFSVQASEEYIHLMWRKELVESDFSHFNVYRSINENSGFEKTKEIDTIGYYDDASAGIEANTDYYYYVTSADKWGNESEPTTTLSGRMTVDLTAPEIISYLPTQDDSLCHTAVIKVSAIDNFKLSSLNLEYRAAGSEEWNEIAELTTDQKTYVFEYNWDIRELAQGIYEVRMTVTDEAGHSTQITTNYGIIEYSIPIQPVLTAQSGHHLVELRWTYSGDSSLVNSYSIYRFNSISEEYELINTTNNTNYIDSVPIGKYTYKVKVTDRFGATAESNSVIAESIMNDTENPVAIIAAENLTADVDSDIEFDASYSKDNDQISSYEWSFGDGATASGQIISHRFGSSGEYDVTLTVTDPSGNKGSDRVIVKVIDLKEETNYSKVTITVLEGLTAQPVSGAELRVVKSNGEVDIKIISRADGKADLVLEKGYYTIDTIKDGYLSRTAYVSVGETDESFTVALNQVNILTGQLTSSELTYEEILEAGIDVNDPDNQHVYKFSTTLEFVAGAEIYQLPVTVYKNSGGTILSNVDGYEGKDGFSGSIAGKMFNVYPISERFYLVIYGEARWLKEMFDVELVVINNSQVEVVENCTATLNLPEGLSLASMMSGAEHETMEIGTIEKGESEKVHWYVRGDVQGEYCLSASVNGRYASDGVLSEPFSMVFETENPLRVWAGDALNLVITAPDAAYRGENYAVNFKLVNVSDKPIYNLSFALTGAEQFQTRILLGAEITGVLTQDYFNEGNGVSIKALNPGEYLELEFSTNIWFSSMLELTDIDVRYYLNNVFVTALEGSTTEIPSTIIMSHVEYPTLYEKIIDEGEGQLKDFFVRLISNYIKFELSPVAKLAKKIYKINNLSKAGDIQAKITIIDPLKESTDPGIRSVVEDENRRLISISTNSGNETRIDENTIIITEDAELTIAALNNGLVNVKVEFSDEHNTTYVIPLEILDHNTQDDTKTGGGGSAVEAPHEFDTISSPPKTADAVREAIASIPKADTDISFSEGGLGQPQDMSDDDYIDLLNKVIYSIDQILKGYLSLNDNQMFKMTTTEISRLETLYAMANQNLDSKNYRIMNAETGTMAILPYIDGDSIPKLVVNKYEAGNMVSDLYTEAKTKGTEQGADEIFVMLDVDIEMDGEEFHTDEPVTITFYLPNCEGKDSLIGHKKNDGTWEYYRTKVDANGYASIVVNGLSPFVIYLLEEWQNPFQDIEENSWFYSSISFVNRYGLFYGTTENTFESDTNMSRAMFVTVLSRLYNISEGDYNLSSFKDVQAGLWYSAPIGWATQTELVKGYGDGLFGTNDEITHEQLCSIFVRYAEYAGINLAPSIDKVIFEDMDDISDWALKDVMTCQQAGLIQGTGNNRFNPKASATRAEVATMLMRFVEKFIN
ncbi:MAG: S-layer homology domain-containing protein [Clostridia bacterium]